MIAYAVDRVQSHNRSAFNIVSHVGGEWFNSSLNDFVDFAARFRRSGRFVELQALQLAVSAA
jgi:hypothetical protein